MSSTGEAQKSNAPLLWVALLAFFILLSYGLCRSAIDSLLQNDHGTEAYKYAYGAVAVAVTVVVGIYSRAAGRSPIGTLMASSAFLSATALALLLLARTLHMPYASYGLYVWKDVYVVVLVELVWTLANSAFQHKTARWAYGFFCVAGTFGDMGGSYLAKRLAHSMGSAQLLYLVIPVLGMVAVSGVWAARACGWPEPRAKSGLGGAWTAVRGSRNIQLMLALVATIQVVTTLIDYQYRSSAFAAYPLLDDRTAAFSQVDVIISQASLGLQFLSGLFVTLLGIRLLVVVLPLMVASAALYYGLHPSFFAMATLKVVNKALDYSLFRTSKELLYRPLTYQEKTQGKAAVDVFGYRVAKGGASTLLIALPGSGLLLALVTATGLGLWLLLALLLVARLGNKLSGSSDAAHAS